MLPSFTFRVARVCRPDGSVSPPFLEAFVNGREGEQFLDTKSKAAEAYRRSPWSRTIPVRCVAFKNAKGLFPGEKKKTQIRTPFATLWIFTDTVYYGPDSLDDMTWDRLSRGHFIPLGAFDANDGNARVPSIANFLGVPFEGRSWVMWSKIRDFLVRYEREVLRSPRPRLFYHGTNGAALKGIEEYGFLEDIETSAGHVHRMMGRGVYVGHFHKAARFALWDGSHRQIRDGTVISALFFPRKDVTVARRRRFPAVFPFDDALRRDRGWDEKKHFLDPKAEWRTKFDGIEIPFGCPLVSNTEWVVKADCLFGIMKSKLLEPVASYDRDNRVNPVA